MEALKNLEVLCETIVNVPERLEGRVVNPAEASIEPLTPTGVTPFRAL
jgi:hypothetical protein